jgi:hypothetical protein
MAQATLDMMAAKNNGLDNAEPRTRKPRATGGWRQGTARTVRVHRTIQEIG